MDNKQWLTEGEYRLPDISAKNLTWINRKTTHLSEMRLCELSLAADDASSFFDKMRKEGMSSEEILPMLWQTVDIPSLLPNETTLSESVSFLHALSVGFIGYDKIAFSSFFSKKCCKGKGLSAQDMLTFSSPVNTSIAYVKNAFSDESYDVFSEQFESCRAVYVSSLKEAVEQVKQEECGYCLLPLEEKGATRLFAAEKLIFQNDLHIVAVTPVFGMDGNAEMKYALVCRGLQPISYTESDDLYLDIRFSKEMQLSLREILDAADMLGMSIYRIATLQLDAEEETSACYSVVFKDEEKQYISLLVFLTLFSSDFSVVGIYKNLE